MKKFILIPVNIFEKKYGELGNQMKKLEELSGYSGRVLGKQNTEDDQISIDKLEKIHEKQPSEQIEGKPGIENQNGSIKANESILKNSAVNNGENTEPPLPDEHTIKQPDLEELGQSEKKTDQALNREVRPPELEADLRKPSIHNANKASENGSCSLLPETVVAQPTRDESSTSKPVNDSGPDEIKNTKKRKKKPVPVSNIVTRKRNKKNGKVFWLKV